LSIWLMPIYELDLMNCNKVKVIHETRII
jgi:hypothetical protein